MSSTGAMNNTSDSEENDKLNEKRRRATEASLRYYYKNKEQLLEKKKERVRTDDEFRAKLVDSVNKSRAKARINNPEYQEKLKRYNKTYYQQTKAKVMLLEKIQRDFEELKNQFAISSQ